VAGEASGDGGCTGGGTGGGGGGADGGLLRFKRLNKSSTALLPLVCVAALLPSSGVSMSCELAVNSMSDPPVIVVAAAFVVAVAVAAAGAVAGAGRPVSRALSFPPNRKPRSVQLTAVLLLVAASAVLGGVTSWATLPAVRASKSPNDWNAAQSSIVVAAPVIVGSSLLLLLLVLAMALSCVAFVENSVLAPPGPKRHQEKGAESLAFTRLLTPLAASTDEIELSIKLPYGTDAFGDSLAPNPSRPATQSAPPPTAPGTALRAPGTAARAPGTAPNAPHHATEEVPLAAAPNCSSACCCCPETLTTDVAISGDLPPKMETLTRDSHQAPPSVLAFAPAPASAAGSVARPSPLPMRGTHSGHCHILNRRRPTSICLSSAAKSTRLASRSTCPHSDGNQW